MQERKQGEVEDDSDTMQSNHFSPGSWDSSSSVATDGQFNHVWLKLIFI